MTKAEFKAKIKEEKPDIFPYDIAVDRLQHGSCIVGCYKDNDIWKCYDIDESEEISLVIETEDESKAFDALYGWIVAKAQMKKAHIEKLRQSSKFHI